MLCIAHSVRPLICEQYISMCVVLRQIPGKLDKKKVWKDFPGRYESNGNKKGMTIDNNAWIVVKII